MFTSNYDAWKTQGPDNQDVTVRTYIEASLTIDFTSLNPDDVTSISLAVQEAITKACIEQLGLRTNDFEVGIETASQEWEE